MFDKLVNVSTNYLIQNNVIDEDDRDVYEYGFYSLYSNIIRISFVLIISIWLNQLAQTIVYHIVFITMRSFAGGFHASTRTKCSIMSTIVWLTSLFTINNFVYPVSYIFLAALSVVLVWIFAPVEHYNNPLSDKKRKSMKSKSRVFSVVFFMIIFFISIVNKSNLWIASSMAYGMISHAIFLIPKNIDPNIMEQNDIN